MVSALWKACAESDAAHVAELLKDASAVDIEIKDHTGVTPLIQAVRSGHFEVIQMLLARDADPNNSSSQGSPDNYTSDPVILEALAAQRIKLAAAQMRPEAYTNDPNYDHAPKAFYGPPVPISYAPYPYIAQSPDGGPPPAGHHIAYYPIPAVQPTEQTDGGPNVISSGLPASESTRHIPCRYFPACRYGSSCMFLHPQTPYFAGPMPPPAQYPAHYDPMHPPHGYAPAYYPMPPAGYPMAAVHPGHVPPAMSPVSSHPTSPRGPMPLHQRSPSELVSPVSAPGQPYGPSSAPPIAYAVPAPMSPYHAPQVLSPMHVPQLLPGHPGPPQTVTSPQMYPVAVPAGPVQPASAFHGRRMSVASFQAELPSAILSNGDPVHSPKSPTQTQPAVEFHPPPSQPRDGGYRGRGGRPSFGSRVAKPPCLFFPSGRCKNGDACRFPHIIPEDGPNVSRFRGARPSGAATIESKLAHLGLRDDANSSLNGAPRGNGHADHESMSGRFGPNGRGGNFSRGSDRRTPPKQQRVPVAEDFPVLRGASTPPHQNGHSNGAITPNGPTAAQVLRAPPPTQKDAPKPLPNGAEPSKPVLDVDTPHKMLGSPEGAAKEVPVSA